MRAAGPVAKTPELARAMRLAVERVDAWPTAAEAARAAGLSERTLSRRFADEARTTWSDFVSDAKMHRAMDLLAAPGARVTQTAFALGYRSLGAFTRAFTRFAGETPKVYRAGCKGDEGRNPGGGA